MPNALLLAQPDLKTYLAASLTTFIKFNTGHYLLKRVNSFYYFLETSTVPSSKAKQD